MTDEEQVVVGRYRLLRRIGTGAMGVVWQGHDERLNRPVAVKKLLLHPALAPRKAAEAVARCLREGRIAARLHHPNAITVFDVVDDDDVPCLVMEYLRSRSLAEVMADEGPLPPVRAADVGAQVAAALVAAHEAGLVPRDITPGNNLLGDDGSVKLTDFGISRSADDDATRTGMFAGTPAYLAPEVALGGEPTPASDVFSLGSTLYAAVEGDPPFGRAANTLGLLHAVAGGRINPPKRSGPLTDVLTALLAEDSHDRPTAAQARDLLTEVTRGDVPPPPVVEPTQPALTPVDAHRSRGPLALTGVFVVALMAVGLWLLGSRDGVPPTEERPPAQHAVPSQTTADPPPETVVPVRAQTPATESRETPATSTEKESPATPTSTDAPSSPAGTSAPPQETTEDAQEPPPDDTSPPPSESSEETVTEPPPTEAE
jgi:serine/threonine protein kinase